MDIRGKFEKSWCPFVISFTNISGRNPVKTTVKTESFNIYQSDDMRLVLIGYKI